MHLFLIFSQLLPLKGLTTSHNNKLKTACVEKALSTFSFEPLQSEEPAMFRGLKSKSVAEEYR